MMVVSLMIGERSRCACSSGFVCGRKGRVLLRLDAVFFRVRGSGRRGLRKDPSLKVDVATQDPDRAGFRGCRWSVSAVAGQVDLFSPGRKLSSHHNRQVPRKDISAIRLWADDAADRLIGDGFPAFVGPDVGGHTTFIIAEVIQGEDLLARGVPAQDMHRL